MKIIRTKNLNLTEEEHQVLMDYNENNPDLLEMFKDLDYTEAVETLSLTDIEM